MGSLENYRSEIDEIDAQLVNLFENRMKVSLEIASYKMAKGLPVLDPAREHAVLKRNIDRLGGDDFASELRKFFVTLMALSKEIQMRELSQKGDSPEQGPKGIGESRRVYGLVGEVLGHSMSPEIHREICVHGGIAGSYHLFEVSKENLGDLVPSLKVLGIRGVNVTIPYKTEIMRFLDELSPEAERIGAVNTVVVDEGIAIGHNTDYFGFGMALEKYRVEIVDRSAVILGTGGASKAVLDYLQNHGIGKVVFVSTDEDKIRRGYRDIPVKSYSELGQMEDADILINCTPVGMTPYHGNSPISKDYLRNFEVAMDLIYNPIQTKMLEDAEGAGLAAINGLYMLVAQAFKAQELWNGVVLDVGILDLVYSVIDEEMRS